MTLSTSPQKRILFIITQSDEGGAQRFLYNLLSRIANRYKVRVAIGSDGGKDLIEKLNGINVETLILKNLKRKISPMNDIRASFEIRDLMGEFQPDTLFLLSSKAGFIGSLALVFPSKIRHIRIIYRIGGWTFNDPWPIWKKKLWIRLEKLSAGWKDIIIVNNRHDLAQANTLGIKPREKTVLIHNGLDPYKLDFLDRDEARVRLFEKISRHSGKIFQVNTIIGAVANFYPAKGLKSLVETAEYFKNTGEAVFVVIGDGPERQAIEEKIKEKGLEKKLFLLGQIKDGYKLMPAFDIFVLPSLKEGFPFALIEAMAAKLPVIATRVGAVPEIIENGKNGYIVEPDKPEQLVKRLKEIIGNDRLCQELGIQAHQTALFKFPLEKMIKEVESTL